MTSALLSVILAISLIFLVRGEDGEDIPIVSRSNIFQSSSLTLMYDPPDGYFAATALGLFVRCNDPAALIYYAVDGKHPSLLSSFASRESPYIQLNTPFGYGRLRNISIVAVSGSERSVQYNLHYFVEGSSRPSSYAFFVPSVESSGYFIGMGIEMNATARAQASGGQEFADFFSELGMGTYNASKQIFPLKLTDLDPELTGFEGGFSVNTTDGRHFGLLVPFHDGKVFSGKMVRVDLRKMIDNEVLCLKSYRMESYVLGSDTIKVTGDATASDACVFVLDLKTIHPLARGFRKGFVNYPYAYLSPGEFNVPVRLDMSDFGIHSSRAIDLGVMGRQFGGYSGGFADGTWACFCPFRTYAGPVGGLRSELPVDANQLRVYFHSLMACVDRPVWEKARRSLTNVSSDIVNGLETLDLSELQPGLRGFSDAVRAGRYAYLSPLSSSTHAYSSQLIRIFLGDTDIGTAIREMKSAGASVGELLTVLDLSQKSSQLFGYSSLFTIGRYLILVPFRNVYEPANGQRGHGALTRVNMNQFRVSGIEFMDLPKTLRTQVPSFNDADLRGFSFGFASGKYALLVPFYNGVFSGKVARFNGFSTTLDDNLQELDLMRDGARPGVFRAYRGGFVSLWQAVF